MNATFCPNCGAKHTFTYAKPKFCSSCGSSLGPELKKSQAAVSQVDQNDDDEDFDDDGESSDINYVPKIRKFEIDVEKYSDSNSFSLGSLFGEDTAPSTKGRRNTSRSLEDFVNDKPRRGE